MLHVLQRTIRGCSQLRQLAPTHGRALSIRSTTAHFSLITSASNQYVKHLVKLRTNTKYRSQQNKVLLNTRTLLKEVADGLGESLHARTLITTEGAASIGLPSEAWLQYGTLVTVTEAVMKKITGLEAIPPSGYLVAELDLPPRADFLKWGASNTLTTPATPPKVSSTSSLEPAGDEPAQLPKSRSLQRLLALDGVQDPGNMGTLLRSALAFGFDGVYLLPGCCDPFNDKAIRASRGACLRTPISEGSLQQLLLIAEAHNLALIAAEPESGMAEPNRSVVPPRKGVCLVLGSEGKGLSHASLQVCIPVAIPMVGAMESLNVGAAGSIMMFALSRDEAMCQLKGRLNQIGFHIS